MDAIGLPDAHTIAIIIIIELPPVKRRFNLRYLIHSPVNRNSRRHRRRLEQRQHSSHGQCRGDLAHHYRTLKGPV